MNSERKIKVFFYGLFMDVSLLKSFGIEATNIQKAQLTHVRLHIGERATLFPQVNQTSYGLVMEIEEDALSSLYKKQGLEDYQSLTVEVELEERIRVSVVTYLLPESCVTGTNLEYAKKLAALAKSLELPEAAIKDIESSGFIIILPTVLFPIPKSHDISGKPATKS